jgi:hypothetical protein
VGTAAEKEGYTEGSYTFMLCAIKSEICEVGGIHTIEQDLLQNNGFMKSNA